MYILGKILIIIIKMIEFFIVDSFQGESNLFEIISTSTILNSYPIKYPENKKTLEIIGKYFLTH